MSIITWKFPTPLQQTAHLTDEISRVKKSEDLVDAWSQVKIPTVHEKNPKDQLILLLKLAAEVEHGLMIEYLYAGYSAKDAELQKQILLVAKQEMGHFLAVQNLLLAVGGITDVHLHKNTIRPQSELAIPYTLEPVSIELLAKYVAVESPIPPPEAFKDEISAIFATVNDLEHVMPHPVGGLYMQIFWLLQQDDNPVPGMMQLSPNSELLAGNHILRWDDALAADSAQKYEADKSKWDAAGTNSLTINSLTVENVLTRLNALKLANDIAAQGEGANLDATNPSHFAAFLIQYRKFKNAKLINAVNLPKNPAAQGSTYFENPTIISHPYSLLWISLSDQIYTSLLLDIYSSLYFKSRADFNLNDIVRLIFDNMKFLLKTIFAIISKLPLENGAYRYDKDPRCGMTFATDKDFKPVPFLSPLLALHKSFSDKINNTVNQIKAHKDFSSHSNDDSNDEGDCQALFDSLDQYLKDKITVFRLSGTI